MLRLSVQARQALSRLTLPVLAAAGFGLMLLGKADTLLADRARGALADAIAPIHVLIGGPLRAAGDAIADAAALWSLREENARLREENDRLRRWQAAALALEAENQRLKDSLNWVPDPKADFVTARAIADAGGLYARAALLATGPNHKIRKGAVALDERGLVGRVTETGARTARVLLLTDINSRIPVVLEDSRARAILAGTNGPRPRLLYWPEGVAPRNGERVVTSAEANALPANLPVGTIRIGSNNVPEVEPDARLQRLEIVRLFDYGLGALPPPEPAERRTPGRH